MSAVFAGRDSGKMFGVSESCSVCLDAVCDSGERSIAKLKCGHHFHLDCIGSAFNAKGAMQCPNCRHVENGQWLYANGSRWNDDFAFEEISYEDDYEVYNTTLSPLLTAREDTLNHFEFCPYGHLGVTPIGSSYHDQFPLALLRDMEGPVSRIRWKAKPTVTGIPDIQTHPVSLEILDGLIEMCAVSSSIFSYISVTLVGSLSSKQYGQLTGKLDICTVLPEVVVNVSYNYNEGGGASSSPPLCPYLEAQGRQSQGAEESRLRASPPALPSAPTRPLDPSGASNSASSIGGFGSLIGEGGGDAFNSSRNIWGPYRDRLSGSGYRGDTPIFTGVPQVPPAMDRLSPTMMDLLHRDTGSGPLAHERPSSWIRTEAERAERLLGTFSAQLGQHGHNESYMEAFPQLQPCPSRRSVQGFGQVGTTSQSQPHSSSLRSAFTPIGSNRRSRQNGTSAPSMSGGGRTESGQQAIGEPSSRRFGQICPDLTLSLGPEPPVPGLDSHGSGGHHSAGQGFVPWGRRDNNPSGPSSSPWTPGQLWHPPTRSSPSLQPNNRFSYLDYMERHGSSQHCSSPLPQSEMEHSSLFSFGIDTAGVPGSMPPRIHLPTPYSISRPR